MESGLSSSSSSNYPLSLELIRRSNGNSNRDNFIFTNSEQGSNDFHLNSTANSISQTSFFSHSHSLRWPIILMSLVFATIVLLVINGFPLWTALSFGVENDVIVKDSTKEILTIKITDRSNYESTINSSNIGSNTNNEKHANDNTNGNNDKHIKDNTNGNNDKHTNDNTNGNNDKHVESNTDRNNMDKANDSDKKELESTPEEKAEFEKDFPLLPIPFPSEKGTIFFLHVPKSGGMSTWQTLGLLTRGSDRRKDLMNFKDKNPAKFSPSRISKCPRLDYLWYEAPPGFGKLEKRLVCCNLVTGHVDVSAENLFSQICSTKGTNLTDKVKENGNASVSPYLKDGHHFFVIMTILRNPIARFISSYFYYNERFAKEKMTIWRYLNWTICKQLDNLETRMLSGATTASFYPEERKAEIASMNSSSLLSLAKKNLRKMFVVGIFERYEETLKFIDNALGLDRNVSANVSTPTASTAARISNTQKYNTTALLEENPGLMEVILSIHKLDLEIYAYANRLFQWRKVKLNLSNVNKESIS